MEKPTKEDVRRVRNAAGLTQTQFARLLELPDRTISRWETGNGGPSALAWAQIVAMVDEYLERRLKEFRSK